VTSGKHKGHEISDVLDKVNSKTRSLKNDLEKLKTRLYPQYDEVASDVQLEKAAVEMDYGKLVSAVEQQGKVWHQEVTTIVNQRKSVIEAMKRKHLDILSRNTDEIAQRITELKKVISDLKSILDSNDVFLTCTYKSRNSEFRTLPPKVCITRPSFSPTKVNKDQLDTMFGSLSSMARDFQCDTIKTSPLLDEPQLTATINTGYKNLYNVSCLSDSKVWTSGRDEIMKILNLRGKRLASIQTESRNIPYDITVTWDGDLVYSDPDNRTVNQVTNKQIRAVITLQGWRPRNICNTSSDDILVTMTNDNATQSKVVRYSGSTEKQTIQFDGQGRPLYSSGSYSKYIKENKNLDICVADFGAKAVVVVNQSGKLRFRYTGHPSNTREAFCPRGIATDSQCHILIANTDNHCIHTLNQDGEFLRYIRNCSLKLPLGLCVDIRDNLFVAECHSAKVKKIRYQ
jgi:hypothetical protein